jgi:hypothetical protein
MLEASRESRNSVTLSSVLIGLDLPIDCIESASNSDQTVFLLQIHPAATPSMELSKEKLLPATHPPDLYFQIIRGIADNLRQTS